MQTIDIAILILLAFGAIRGFIKGFIFEVAMLGALVLCYFLGFKMAAAVGSSAFTSGPKASMGPGQIANNLQTSAETYLVSWHL